MSWDGDVLVVDPDNPRLVRVPRKRLSASTSTAMQDCPARWVTERLVPRDTDPFAPLHVGSVAHAVMEDLFDRPFDKRTPADAHSLLITVTERHEGLCVPDGSDPVVLAKWRDRVILAMAGLWDIEDPSKVVAGQREQHLDQVSVNGVPLTGFVDRVDPVVTGDGTVGLQIVDYKTGKWSTQSKLKMYGDDYAEQLRLYALALKELTGNLPVRASLYYTAVGKSRDIPLGPRLLAQTADRFVDSWEKHNEYTSSGRYPTKPSGLCNFCPLATVCPAAAASDREINPRNDTYLYGEAMLGPLTGSAEPGAVHPPVPDAHPMRSVSDEPPLAEPPDGPFWPPAPTEDARHTRASTDRQTEESESMTGTTGPWSVTEDKAWEETSQGDIQPNAFAATAVFGITSMAVGELYKARQPITGTTVQALSLTLSSLVLDVQHHLSGHANFQRGLNVRLRGALHTTLDTLPVPFGSDEEAWEDWYATTKRRMTAIAVTAHKLWEIGVVDRPYADLVTATTARQPVPTTSTS